MFDCRIYLADHITSLPTNRERVEPGGLCGAWRYPQQNPDRTHSIDQRHSANPDRAAQNSTAFDPDGVGSIFFTVRRARGTTPSAQPTASTAAAPRRGLMLIAAGELLVMWTPINKQLWPPSFAVLMAVPSTTGLACFIWLADLPPVSADLWRSSG